MLLPSRRFTCAAFCFLLVCAPTAASERLVADMTSGRLDHFSLLEAAGTVGGMDPGSIDDARQRLQNVVVSLDRERHTTSAGRLAALLSLLHDRIFIGRYDAAASQISSTLAHGNFNCASSTVLLLIAADMADLSARAVLLPGHLRCRVWIDEQRRWVDIEPSVRPGTPDRANRNEPTSKEQERELTHVQLLAKLYYNLGIDELRQQNYGRALQCARYAWQFDRRHMAARDNVAAIVNNWSLALCQQQKFEGALKLIHDGLRQSPEDRLLSVNEIHIYVAWMNELLHRGDLGGVELRLHDALARYPDSALLRAIDHRLRQTGSAGR